MRSGVTMKSITSIAHGKASVHSSSRPETTPVTQAASTSQKKNVLVLIAVVYSTSCKNIVGSGRTIRPNETAAAPSGVGGTNLRW
jgi:hypothetical protein